MASHEPTMASCNATANFTGNSSPCSEPPPMMMPPNPYLEFYNYAFGSSIYMLVVALVTVTANGLLLVVFFFDPLKTFRNSTTYFLVGLAFVDIVTAAVQMPMYISCFMMMYFQHPNVVVCLTLFDVGMSMSVTAMNTSFFIVFAFTVTQFIVVISPLNYARKVTKRRVIYCVLAIYIYTILFSVSRTWGVPEEVLHKIDNIFHSIILIYLTIVFYILLYAAFRKSMAASKSLRGENKLQDRGNAGQTRVERKFIIINFLLIVILFVCSQPSAMLWVYLLYSNNDPNDPNILIVNLMVDNALYLKFMLDPFVYAWRIPKYRQALKIVLCCRDPDTVDSKSKFHDRVVAEMNKSRDTVVTLDFRSISQD